MAPHAEAADRTHPAARRVAHVPSGQRLEALAERWGRWPLATSTIASMRRAPENEPTATQRRPLQPAHFGLTKTPFHNRCAPRRGMTRRATASSWPDSRCGPRTATSPCAGPAGVGRFVHGLDEPRLLVVPSHACQARFAASPLHEPRARIATASPRRGSLDAAREHLAGARDPRPASADEERESK